MICINRYTNCIRITFNQNQKLKQYASELKKFKAAKILKL